MTVPMCEWCGEYHASPGSKRCRLCEPEALDHLVAEIRRKKAALRNAERHHRTSSNRSLPQ